MSVVLGPSMLTPAPTAHRMDMPVGEEVEVEEEEEEEEEKEEEKKFRQRVGKSSEVFIRLSFPITHSSSGFPTMLSTMHPSNPEDTRGMLEAKQQSVTHGPSWMSDWGLGTEDIFDLPTTIPRIDQLSIYSSHMHPHFIHKALTLVLPVPIHAFPDALVVATHQSRIGS